MYGIQWHAEKPLFEWYADEVINHTPDAIVAMQYMADFTGLIFIIELKYLILNHILK